MLDEADMSPAGEQQSPGVLLQAPALDAQGGMHAPPADAPLGDTLSIREAAELLGKDASTIRRRIQRKHIAAYKRETEHGYEWRIFAESLGAAPLGMHPLQDASPLDAPGMRNAHPLGVQAQENARPVVPELMKALEIIEDIRSENREELEQLRQKNEELTGTAAHWQARAIVAEEQARQAQEQVKLLMAPKDEPITVDEAQFQAQPRRWWQRIFS
jgi:excisionase family DNA binding protein